MFDQARLKLTFWYILISMSISLLLSGLFYQRASWLIKAEFNRIERRIHSIGLIGPNMPIPPGMTSPEELLLARRRLLAQLAFINLGVFIFSASGSYFLAAQTLSPIKETMSKQQQFISDAAHELKTPITALKTSLQVNLMDKKLAKSAQKILQENLEDVENLEKLIESLFKLASLQETKAEFSKVRLAETISMVEKTVSPLAKQKKIKLKIKSCVKNQVIWADQQLLVQLLIILLDNAIKYSSGKSKVELSCEVEKNSVKIVVEDQGVGIAQHHLPYIFDRFYRVDTARSRSNQNGFGLGLALAKEIVELHNGKIKVHSQPDQGSSFIVILPLHNS